MPSLPAQQLGQNALALEQRRARQIRAVEMQQVEQVVAEAVAAAFAQVGLQVGEARRSLLGLHHHLAVEKGGDDRQRFERLLERREFASSSRARCGS